MNELMGTACGILLALGFLIGFSTQGTTYVQERQAYYKTLEQAASDEQTRAVYRHAAKEVFLGPAQKGHTTRSLHVCTTEPYPRMTKLGVLGASEKDNRRWHVRNEQACLEELKTQFQADGNTIAVSALDQIHLPQD